MYQIHKHFNACKKIISNKSDWSDEDEADFNEKTLDRVANLIEMDNTMRNTMQRWVKAVNYLSILERLPESERRSALIAQIKEIDSSYTNPHKLLGFIIEYQLGE